MKKNRFSAYFYNPVSYLGAFLALLVFVVECFLFAIDFFAHGQNLYLGLLTYVFLPPFLIAGLLLIPAGALWKRRRVRLGVTPLEPRPLHIDLLQAHHRNMLFVFVTGTLVLVLMTFAGAYKAFQYTESVQFCGLLCHQVMKPEHTAYLHSPHSRVRCVACHIGEGADWYVRSKLSGARQVVRTITDTYKKPIDTPVRNLRPAEETCEQCHWPGKLYSTFDLKRTYFLTEGDERRWHLRMLLNVGGGKNDAHGVHAHMNVDRDIYYAAEDERRQKITWVKSVDKDGTETVYVSPGSKWKESPPPPEAVRKMDCIDCHNRPTHQFTPPSRLVNEGLAAGRLDPSLPQIKEKALSLLAADYGTEDEAKREIPARLAAFYEKEHPETAREKAGSIRGSADYLNEVFARNMFPEMKARWDVFPDNIGHLSAPGCFRCHDGEHRSAAQDRVITRDCAACHLIVEQGPAGAVEKDLDGLPFRHPLDDDNGWRDMNCNDCHTGAGP